MSGAAAAAPGRFPWLFAVLGLFAFVTLLALGTWQVQRLQWKEGLLATIEARRTAAPLPLAEIEALHRSIGDVDYMPATVTGIFRHGGERHFLATWKGQSGFFVYTPLELEDGRFVFINRGFVPYGLKDPSKRPSGQVEGEVTVNGLARNPLQAKPSSLVPDNDPARNVFYWKDRDAMARSANLRAGAEVVQVFIDAGDTPNPGGYPVGGVTLIDLPNSHLQYAVTWYGLAAALVAVMGVAWWRSRKRANPPFSH
ncbi:SURF1 family protein [Mesorhizobium sp. KR9-304]|uniref:SURF1 family protein n=1 Tax=Mesorhizobium sp. KR9-304 TaxID=3156614 RepID=UPI0032B470D3